MTAYGLGLRLRVLRVLSFSILAGQASNAARAGQDLQASDGAYSVSVVESREIPYAPIPGVRVRQVALRVVPKRGGPPRTILIGGPNDYLNDDLRELRLVDDQLIALTACEFAVSDLRSGKERLFVNASCAVKVSPDGRRVAYLEFKPHMVDPHASTSVLRVLDVASLATYTVLPDGPNLELSGGVLTTWEDDLSQVHSLNGLYWSPDSNSLVSFCLHGQLTPGDPSPEQPYLVVVDLRDLKHSRYVHRLIPDELYRRPGAAVTETNVIFPVEGIEWLDRGAAVRVIPPPYATWMKQDIVLKLPSPQ